MVDDVDVDTYLLSTENPAHLYTKFEAGLQAWGEIIALGEAIAWLERIPKNKQEQLAKNAKRIFDFFETNGTTGNINLSKNQRDQSSKKLHLLNSTPTPTLSFYVDGLDSHSLGEALAEEGIMARTGYFCVHYFLDHKMQFPPLVRISLGYHNTEDDTDHLLNILKKVL